MNTRKPTKEDVLDMEWCWCSFSSDNGWYKHRGWYVRELWRRGYCWLPYDAIPDPSQKQNKRSKP